MNDADEILYHLAFRTEVLVVDDNDLCTVFSQMTLETAASSLVLVDAITQTIQRRMPQGILANHLNRISRAHVSSRSCFSAAESCGVCVKSVRFLPGKDW